MNSKLVIKLLIAVSIVLSSAGCSVMMAAKGSDDIDLSVLRPGVNRKTVEKALGKPIASTRPNVGPDVITYQYFTDDEPSYGRAAAYGVLDIVTVFLAELVTTPIEALQGNKHTVEVRYNGNGQLIDYQIYSLEAPIKKPEKILGIEK